MRNFINAQECEGSAGEIKECGDGDNQIRVSEVKQHFLGINRESSRLVKSI